jgi:hypothetical protein
MLRGLLHRLGRRGVPSRALVPSSYLTDGRRLFRVVSRLAAGYESMFVLEDCVTLDVQAFPRAELDVMGLRAVRPAGTVGATTGDVSKTYQSGDGALAVARAEAG